MPFNDPKPIAQLFTYSVCCTECGKKATFTRKEQIRGGFTLRMLHDGGLEDWIESPTKGCNEFAHVPCREKKEKEFANSDDLFERIRGGRFDSDSPNYVKTAVFHEEAIEYAGLTGHPKANKAYSLASERYESHYERINLVSFLTELAELLK
jgi:hypothetical protein